MKAKNGSNVSVHYRGTLTDGTEFDNSRVRGETLDFQVGVTNMISGFTKAVIGMTEGQKKSITLSPDEAYGNRNPEALLNLLAESCGIQFGLVTTFVDLIASKGEDASYLGTPYWFAHTFKYSLDKRVARILLEKSLSHKTRTMKSR